MKDVFLFSTVALLIEWLVGLTGFVASSGLFIYLLLVLATNAMLLKIIVWEIKGGTLHYYTSISTNIK